MTKSWIVLGNVGTAMRPLTAALAMYARLGAYSLQDSACMREQPIGDRADASTALGCTVRVSDTRCRLSTSRQKRREYQVANVKLKEIFDVRIYSHY